jgi:hypothetical protein
LISAPIQSLSLIPHPLRTGSLGEKELISMESGTEEEANRIPGRNRRIIKGIGVGLVGVFNEKGERNDR